VFTGHRGPADAPSFSPDGRTLATGSMDTTVLLWDVRRGAPGKRPSTPRELEALWLTLGGADGAQAYDAVLALAAPGPAVPFLRGRLRPVPAPKNVDRLLADLDDDEFEVRQKARAALEALGDAAEPALRKLLAGKPSLEVRRQAEAILRKLHGKPLPPEQVRLLRALEALEHAGTPEARRVLEILAKGAPGARLTREAAAAAKRLAKSAP
jgi:hypothetical protein